MKNIQNKLSLFILFALMSFGVNAQIDRSTIPVAGPEPRISLEKPYEFDLKNGIKVLVVENDKLPRVSYSLSIDNKPAFEGDKAGVLSLLSAMLGNGTTNISKDDFNEEVDFLGASVNFSSSGGFASSLSKYSDRILELMADATINPLLTEEEFEKEKEKLLESLKNEETNLDAITSRVGGALSYGKDHVYGEFVTKETIENVEFQDVLDYYKMRFNPNNAYIVVVGDISAKAAKKQIKKYFNSWEKAELAPIASPQMTANLASSEIDFIDMPNAVQSSIAVTNNVDLKMSDEDYFSALIMNNILGGGGEGYLFKNLREDKGYTYGAYSRLGSSRYGVSKFNASAKVRNVVTDSAVVEFLYEIKRIRTEPVDPQTLKDAKAKYVGNFVMALERPQTVANYALNIKRNNLPDDFYANYLENINQVSVEDVQRAADKYVSLDQARIIVVGKGSEVVSGLEKIGLPINYFDTYANPVAKPEFTKPIPAGVTAATVFSGYIAAIGGTENVEAVKSVSNTSEVTIPGAPFKPTSVLKQTSDKKFSMVMSAPGMGALMKQAFDGEKGYIEQQGRKMPMGEDQVAKMKSNGLFPELNMSEENTELLSISPVDGVDAYKVKVTTGEDSSFRYYAVDSNLLIRTEESQEAQGQTVTTLTDYGDYKEVEGVMVPFLTKIVTGPQTILMNSTEVLINSGVSAADFE